MVRSSEHHKHGDVHLHKRSSDSWIKFMSKHDSTARTAWNSPHLKSSSFRSTGKNCSILYIHNHKRGFFENVIFHLPEFVEELLTNAFQTGFTSFSGRRNSTCWSINDHHATTLRSYGRSWRRLVASVSHAIKVTVTSFLDFCLNTIICNMRWHGVSQRTGRLFGRWVNYKAN